MVNLILVSIFHEKPKDRLVRFDFSIVTVRVMIPVKRIILMLLETTDTY